MATSSVTSNIVSFAQTKRRHWSVRFILLPLFALIVGDLQLAVLTGCSGGCCSTCCQCSCFVAGSSQPEDRCGEDTNNLPFDNSCISSCAAVAGQGEQCNPK